MAGQNSSSDAGAPAEPTDDPQGAHSGITDLVSARAEIAKLEAALARADERERRLADDLHHRVRNMLAMIRSIARQSWEEDTDPAEYAQHLQGRLDAMARYQTRFGRSGSTGFDLEDMIRDELLQTSCLDGPRCVIAGPAVAIHDRQAELVGLALHELATNAIKFGAFAGGGRLSVEWKLHQGVLEFRWAEADVAIASPAPRPSGFGRRLIESGLPYELGAATSFDLRPGGLVCTISLPLSDARPGKTGVNEVPASRFDKPT